MRSGKWELGGWEMGDGLGVALTNHSPYSIFFLYFYIFIIYSSSHIIIVVSPVSCLFFVDHLDLR